MPTRSEIVALYLDAQKSRDEGKIKQLEGHIADNIVLASPMGSTEGKEKILSRMRGDGGRMAQLTGQLNFSAPVESDGKVTVSADMPPGLPMPFPIQGIDLKFSFTEANLISKIDFSPRM
jgi:hypothetical protein